MNKGAHGFGFSSHWLENWREIFKLITKREQSQSRNYFPQSFENGRKIKKLTLLALAFVKANDEGPTLEASAFEFSVLQGTCIWTPNFCFTSPLT